MAGEPVGNDSLMHNLLCRLFSDSVDTFWFGKKLQSDKTKISNDHWKTKQFTMLPDSCRSGGSQI